MAPAAAAVKHWWAAYIAWRVEQAAIVQLQSMSDRDLKDIGLTRSEIARAVRGGRRQAIPVSPLRLSRQARKHTAMNINMVYPPWPTRRARVIALHCSGAGAGQWSHLAEALGGELRAAGTRALRHARAPGRGPASTPSRSPTKRRGRIALIDQSEGKVHLVGHSYGGGVALHVALARPDRIASMALYEPSAFHLLRQMGEPGALAFAEIAGVARRTCEGVVTGDYRGAASAFVDYWNGPGAWNAMRPAVQSALIRWSPKAPLDFRALIDEPTAAGAYRALRFPTLILRGEHAPMPTRIIAEGLSQSPAREAGSIDHRRSRPHGPVDARAGGVRADRAAHRRRRG